MRTLLLCSILIFSVTGHAQIKPFVLIEQVYSKWKQAYSTDKLKCDTFLYSDIVDEYACLRVQDLFQKTNTFYSHSNSAKKENITFTSKERKFIITSLQGVLHKQWKDNLFAKSRLVKFAAIDSSQKSLKEQRVDPLLRLCSSVHVFSPPIFLRNNTLCIFYSGTINFAVKEGEFWLYKKDKSGWIKFSPLYTWIE